MPSNKPTFDEVEQLLRDGLASTPVGFEQRVLDELPTRYRQTNSGRFLGFVTWLGAGLGGCFGFAQVLRYVFGIWFASAAG